MIRLAAFLAVAAIHATSAAAQVPHRFAPGTPARASDVNENFDALTDDIDDLATRIQSLEQNAGNAANLFVVDSFNRVIGPVVAFDSQGVNAEVTIPYSSGEYKIIGRFTPTGFGIVSTRISVDVYFTTTNCTSTPYLLASTAQQFSIIEEKLRIEPVAWDGNRLIVASGPKVSGLIINSFLDRFSGNPPFTTACAPQNGFVSDAYPAEFVDFYALHPPPYDVIPQ